MLAATSLDTNDTSEVALAPPTTCCVADCNNPSTICCAACKSAFYCSDECKNNNSTVHSPACKWIQEYGINGKDRSGGGFLHVLRDKFVGVIDTKAVRHFLDIPGVDPDLKNNLGETYLMGFVKYFAFGSMFLALNARDQTALKQGHLKTIELLLEKGASPYIKNYFGKRNNRKIF